MSRTDPAPVEFAETPRRRDAETPRRRDAGTPGRRDADRRVVQPAGRARPILGGHSWCASPCGSMRVKWPAGVAGEQVVVGDRGDHFGSGAVAARCRYEVVEGDACHRHQRVGPPLRQAAVVVGGSCGEGADRGGHERESFGVEPTFERSAAVGLSGDAQPACLEPSAQSVKACRRSLAMASCRSVGRAYMGQCPLPAIAVVWTPWSASCRATSGGSSAP